MAAISVLAAVVAIQTSNGGTTTYGQTANDVAPTVSSVSITSNTADEVSAIDDNGVYGIDDDIEVTVTFSADIRVTGNPKIEIDVGGHARDALYQSHSGTAIIFSYTVAENDEDTDGVSIDANRLTTDGGTIESPSGTAATLTHTALSNQSSHKVDGVRPTIQSVSHSQGRSPRQNIYIAGDIVIVTVKFSEEVLVTGTPQIKLDLDGKEKLADFQTAYNSCAAEAVTPLTTCLQRIFLGNRRGQATSFYYTVAKGDQDTNGFAVPANAINLNQGSIKDAAGNTATLTHVTLADSPQGIIDGVAPTISSITITSDPGDDDTYHSGEAITLQVTFTERLIMEGSVDSGHIPYLKLNVGDNARSANFTESNPEALNFAYVVRPTDEDTDGISIPANPIVLNDSKIYDRPNPNALGKNNPADLTHPGVPEAPGHKVSGASSAGTRGNNPQTQSLIIKGDPKVGQMLSVDTSGLTEHGDSSETAASTETSDHRDGRATSIDVSLAATIAALDDGAKACASYLEPEPQDQRRAPADDSETMTIAWLAPDDDGYKVLQSSEEETYTITEDDVGRSILAAVQYTDSEGQQQVLASVPTTVITKNTPATGSPAIGGTPQVGETLTVDTSSISDDDGLTSVSYSYQWIAGDTEIDGATGSSYLLTSSEQGKTIKVRVSFADDAENKETLTSAATVAIKPQSDNPQPAAPLWSANMLVVEYSDISIGAAYADLFSNIGGTGNLKIRTIWSYRPDDDLRLAFQSAFKDAEDHQLIVGDLTLAFPEGSSGEASFKWTNVGIDWTDGQTIAVSIVPTTTTEPTPNTAATGLPTISGTPQVDQTLTAGTSAIADDDGLDAVSYNYQWIRSDNGADTDIAGETASTYTLVFADQGKTIRVRVTFTDDRDNAESMISVATVAVAAAPNREATGKPTISGTPEVGEILTAGSADIGDADGLNNVSYNYQWLADDANIQHATGSSHTLTDEETDKTIKVRVTFDDDDGNGETLTSVPTEAVQPAVPQAPQNVLASPRDASTLDVSWEAPASDGGSAITSYVVQWKKATDSWDTTSDVSEMTVSVTSHRITGLVEGVEYTVRVAAANDVGQGASSSDAYGTPQEVIIWSAILTLGSGTNFLGYTIFHAVPGISVPIGILSANTFTLEDTSHTVKALGVLDGTLILSLRPKTTASFVLNLDTVTFLSAEASTQESPYMYQFRWDDPNLEWSAGSEITVSMTEPEENSPATGAPAINGTARVRETLTADVSGIGDANGRENAIFAYEWFTIDDTDAIEIPGETGATLTLADDHAGKSIRVRVNFTDDASNEETLTSKGSEIVQPTVPTAPSAVTVSSGQEAGELDLTWQAPTSNGGTPITGYKIQWKESTASWEQSADVSETTTSGTTLTITELTSGTQYSVRVAATNTQGDGAYTPEATGTATEETAESNSEPEETNSPATGAPTISGTPQVEETLTASTSNITDEDGLTNVSYEYQWTSNGSDITGATSSSYTLTASEQGETIQVRIDFTDDKDNDESLTSAATTAVAATPLTASFGNVPDSHLGTWFEFTLSFSENVKAGYERIRDDAFTVSGGDVTKANRTQQGSNQHWNVRVKPDGNGDLSITLPATTDCDADGAICTDDRRNLSNSVTIMVSGPAP